MRAVVQRVRNASVTVSGEVSGAIESGLLVYLGIRRGDAASDLNYLVRKITGLRIFPDKDGRMNLGILESQPSHPAILVVSQFTLYGDVRKGRRPSYNDAAPPEEANQLYQQFLAELGHAGAETHAGVFQEHMDVTYTNDGPVTILIDSTDR